MASLLSRNVLFAGKIMTRSVTSTPSFQLSRGLNTQLIQKPIQPLVSARYFAAASGKDHLREGLPEQYQWTADHLEKYLRNFANKYNYKQNDVDHLIKTFVSGSSSASDFFKLDRESLAAKIGKESPERTKMANDLVAEVWKETEAVGRQMQSYGSILIGIAAVVFGAWVYNSYSGSSSDTKQAAKDTKDKASSAAKDAKDKASSAAHDAKDKGTSMKDAAKDKVSSAAHDAKDKISSAASDAKDKVSSAAHGAMDKAKSAASEIKSAAKDVKDTAASGNKEEAKTKAAQAFKDDGAVGKQFTEKGAVGGAAQKAGGPLDKDGAVGKQFTKEGSIGGKVQQKAEQKEAEHKERSK